jgi:hypothetical protein
MERKPHTEESKRKMSLVKMGHPVSVETRRKISLAQKGRKNFLGKHHSEETKRKISLNRKGKCLGSANHNYHRQFSVEQLAKMSASHRGYIMPESQKIKISESNKKNDRLINHLRQMAISHRGIPLSKATRAKISASRIGEKNPAWNGGRTIDGCGYVRVLQKGHPNADRDGYVLEHRLIVEKILGRNLKSSEVVHHINEIRDDNRPNNLMPLPNKSAHQKIHMKIRSKKKDLAQLIPLLYLIVLPYNDIAGYGRTRQYGHYKAKLRQSN